MCDELRTLAESLHDSQRAIASLDIEGLEDAVARQRESVAWLKKGDAVHCMTGNATLAAQVASQSAILARLVRRSSTALDALLSLSTADIPYSLKSLPRR